MTIQKVEEQTGLSRSNIRFYEKERLIQPQRLSNGYRDYSETDVANIKKIAYLRTLGISIEDIKAVMCGQKELLALLEQQSERIEKQRTELEHIRYLCNQMRKNKELCYENLNVEEYVKGLPNYWKKNKNVLQWDVVGFMTLWGGTMIWFLLAVLAFVSAVVSILVLPSRIPIQWRDGQVVSDASKWFVFVYPVACILLRLFLRPVVQNRLDRQLGLGEDFFADYITNFLCFVALSLELFTFLYVFGLVSNVAFLLIFDGVVFLCVLLCGIVQCQKGISKR